MAYTLSDLAEQFDLTVADGTDPGFVITHLCGLNDTEPTRPTGGDRDQPGQGLSFVADARLAQAAAASLIPAFIAHPDYPVPGKQNLLSPQPELAIARIAGLFVLEPMRSSGQLAQTAQTSNTETTAQTQQIHPTAVLGENVSLGQQVAIGANVVIGSDVTIGDHCRIHANSVIMDQVTLDEHCLIYPNVTIREGCQLGKRVILQPGAVIGGDGFGYTWHAGKHHKIPQIGIVILGDDVEIGANTTIDRGRFAATSVGNGSKIDNLVMLGHNVITGENCLLISQVGVAGSTRLGNHVILGGQAGVNGHIELGDGVTIMGQTMVSKGIKEPGVYAGQPVRPAHIWRRAVARFYKGLK